MKFFVPGDAVAQPRHRAGRNPKTGKAQHYIPKGHPVKGFKDEVRLRAKSAAGAKGVLAGPLSVLMLFVFEGDSVRATWHDATPDIDNLAKAAFDACKGVVYADDRQVADARALKVISGPHPPGLYALFEPAEDVDRALARIPFVW